MGIGDRVPTGAGQLGLFPMRRPRSAVRQCFPATVALYGSIYGGIQLCGLKALSAENWLYRVFLPLGPIRILSRQHGKEIVNVLRRHWVRWRDNEAKTPAPEFANGSTGSVGINKNLA